MVSRCMTYANDLSIHAKLSMTNFKTLYKPEDKANYKDILK